MKVLTLAAAPPYDVLQECVLRGYQAPSPPGHPSSSSGSLPPTWTHTCALTRQAGLPHSQSSRAPEHPPSAFASLHLSALASTRAAPASHTLVLLLFRAHLPPLNSPSPLLSLCFFFLPPPLFLFFFFFPSTSSSSFFFSRFLSLGSRISRISHCRTRESEPLA